MNRTSIALLTVAAMLAVPGAAQVRVVNMIPNAQSNETNQDSEPNLAVNPANPQQMAGSAFTPDPAGGANAPIFVSIDGGATWAMNNIVPSTAGGATGDITLRFGGTSGVLYGGILRLPGSLRLNILRTASFTGAALMDVLVDRNSVDQPYVQAATVMGGAGVGNDRVYVGLNDTVAANGGRTATVETSLDAATAAAPAGLTTRNIETRTTNGQDGPPIRPAIHADGTIYAAFFRRTASSGSLRTVDLVVVRDNVWASGGTQYAALTDSSDSLAGRLVMTNLTVPFINSSQPTFGQERLVYSSLSTTVDPRDSRIVYVAWGDFPTVSSTTFTLHVRRSGDSGVTWSATDLLTVSNAMNPALAINTHGKVGFAYQQLTGAGSRWETHLRRSVNDGGAWDDLTLSNTPSNTPVATFIPYLGDYMHLMAVGKDFYGIFSANNTPDPANFPSGVTWQRNFDSGTNQLRNFSNTANVAASIDPFFFQVTEVAGTSDFYVRDWSTATAGDTGVEPSTNPVFYTTSDVWNRRSTSPGAFPSGGPENEAAGNGTDAVGRNWAFARIRRNSAPGSGASTTATAHFLVSRFGTGSNYIDANDDPASFPNADPAVLFSNSDTGPSITPAWQWQLPAVASTHLCLAVEITTPDDPFVAPSLRGNTPGWPLTDLRILNDNNKAQRNMGLSTTPAEEDEGGALTWLGIVHNAATLTRDVRIRWQVPPELAGRIRKGTIDVIGGRSLPLEASGEFVLPRMTPGENRWVGLTFEVPRGKAGEIVYATFDEVADGVPVNGFAVGAKLASSEDAMRATLDEHRSLLNRYRAAGARNVPAATQSFERMTYAPVTRATYLRTMRDFARWTVKYGRFDGTGDPFGIEPAARTLEEAAKRGRFGATVIAHASLLNKADAYLTRQELANGDAADALQMVRWQRDLVGQSGRLASLGCRASLIADSTSFIDAYQRRNGSGRDYAAIVTRSMPCLEDALQLAGSGSRLAPPSANATAAQAQKIHRLLLTGLEKAVQ
jgi:hypothetical protein